MGETVKKGSCHFGIAKDAWPFAKGEVRRDDNRCSLVELRDEMGEQLPASLSEGEIAGVIEHDEVEPGQVVGDTTLATGAALDPEVVDPINDTEEPTPRTVADERTSYGDGQMRLSRAGSADHSDVALIGDERATRKVADQVFVDGCTGEVEVIDIFCQGQLGDSEL